MSAQTREKVAFEVASVKPSGPDSGMSFRPRWSGDGFSWRGAPVDFMVYFAFDVGYTEVAGMLPHGPEPRYDIEARLSSLATESEVRRMFQTLLEDRFALKVHYETREMLVYDLVVAPRGAHLDEAQADSKVIVGGKPLAEGFSGITMERDGRHLAGKGVPLAQLARALSGEVNRLVVDRTGISGTFDFNVVYAPDDSQLQVGPPLPIDAPPIRTALEDKLGLRLQSARRPVQVLVVDGIGKPTPN